MSDPVFSFEKVYNAYRQCRKKKRRRRSTLRFELNAEENLLLLSQALQTRAYSPLPSVCFVTESPKQREIFAADFQDRIVHHLLVSHLEPIWEPRFIFDSFACRKKKGTHRAVKRLQRFMRQITGGGSRKAYFLHLDIRSFFVSIDKKILFDIFSLKERNPDIRWLLETLIFHDPTQNVIVRGRKSLFDQIPPHKSLFHTRNKTGLPIGNYTSQFFANVYLDRLDQFVKHGLKCRHYLRYVDDLVLLSPSRRELAYWQSRIERFLGAELNLSLNQKRRMLAPVRNGCDFLGYVVRPSHLLVRKRTVNNFKQRLKSFENRLTVTRRGMNVVRHNTAEIDRLQATVASYLGHLSHASTFRLVHAIFQRNVFLRNYFNVNVNKLIRTDKPPVFYRLDQQYRYFSKCYGDYFLLFQVGCYYEFFGARGREAGSLFGLKPGSTRPRMGKRRGFPVGRLRPYLDRAVSIYGSVVIVRQTGRVSGLLTERRIHEVIRK